MNNCPVCGSEMYMNVCPLCDEREREHLRDAALQALSKLNRALSRAQNEWQPPEDK